RAPRDGAQSPDHHLSGRYPPAPWRRAEIQVRGGGSLFGDGRSVSADRSQFRPVLAATLDAPISRDDPGRGARSDPAGLGKEAFCQRLQHDVEAATARLVAEGERELIQNGTRDASLAPSP